MIKLRIVSGKYKSRRISAPDDIRPTKDNVREAVFNVMAAYIKDAKVLDLFAGSGAFGLEALSRGASYALFVDNSVASARAVRKNLKSLESAEAAEVIAKDAIAAIKLLYKRGDKFDIIFLDPPYYGNLLRKCLKNINLYDILTHSGLIIAEHFKKDPVPAQAETLILTRQLVYGDTIISIYKKRLSDD